MRHRLNISVSKKPANDGIVACRTVTIRERFLRSLFGSPTKLTIVVPGDSVAALSISEEMGGEQDV